MFKTRRLVVILLQAMQLLAQPTLAPAFDVASIKLHILPVRSVGISISGTRVTVTASSVTGLIGYAYDLKHYQIFGGPNWMKTDRWDIVATTESEKPLTTKQAKQMMQALLTDRFQVKIHREMREMPVYALVVGKKGSKLKDNNDPSATYTMSMSNPNRVVATTTTKGTMEQLAYSLSLGLDRPVLDMTGLAGTYDYKLEWIPDAGSSIGPDPLASDSNTSSLFTALQEQLGLKLEPTKRPIDILIIDRVEKPSEN